MLFNIKLSDKLCNPADSSLFACGTSGPSKSKVVNNDVTTPTGGTAELKISVSLTE